MSGLEELVASLDHERRRQALTERMTEERIAGAVVAPGPNLSYLTGFYGEPFDRHVLLFLSANGDATFVAPESHAWQVRAATDVGVLHTVDGNDPALVAGELLGHLPSRDEPLLLDDRTPRSLARHLSPERSPESFRSLSDLLAPLRREKTEAEIEALRRAAVVADGVSVEVRTLGEAAIGMTERELAAEIRSRLFAKGAERLSFDVVVASGPNGADPGRRHGGREIERGDPVVLDFGGVLAGYASDQTRTTVFAGSPPETFERVHGVVREALAAGVEAVEPGVTASTVDAAARDVIEEAGFGEAFTHPTGHGVGVDAHEALAIAPGSDVELAAGMVFSVEPGIYLQEFGVRLEDLVVVNEGGRERLNDSPRTWRPLD